MAVGEAHVFPGFLTPVLTQLSFQSRQLLFSHASPEVRSKNMLEKVRLNQFSNSQPPCHKFDTLTTKPPGQGKSLESSKPKAKQYPFPK